MKLFRRSKNNNLSNKLKVLFQIDGGIGDLVSALCLVETFYKDMGCPQIDLLVLDYRISPLLEILGGKKPPYINDILGEIGIEWKKRSRKILKNYHLKVTTQTSLVSYSLLDKSFLSKHVPYFYLIYERYDKVAKNFSELYEAAPYADHQVAKMANFLNLNRKGILGYSSCLPITNDSFTTLYINPDKIKLIENLSLEPKKYITIHSGYDPSKYYTSQSTYESKETGELISSVSSTKEWPQERFHTLLKKIKSKYPDLKILNIMGPNSEKMEGADINFQGDLQEIIVLLKNSFCHIDGESGLVRIARELGTKSVVIFGPTNFDFFKFEENINMKPSVCGNCFWLDKLWLNKCMKGFHMPACTNSITVDQVFNAFNQNYHKFSHASPLEIQDVFFYGEEEAIRNKNYIQKIFKSANLDPVPVAQHANPTQGQHIFATKQWEYAHAAEQIHKLKTQKLKFANVGDSRGAFSTYIASLGLELDQYDNHSPHSQSNFEKDSEYFKIAKEKHFSANFGSIYNLPCASDSYDVVTCFSQLQYHLHKSYALYELVRILKPGGLLILTFDLSYKLDQEKIDGIEVLNLESIQSLLKDLKIDFDTSSLFKRLAKSAQVIQDDGVCGVSKGMTIGSLTIQKLKDKFSVEPSKSLSEALASKS